MRKEEFVSYDLVIELQKIDFNEPCIAFYNGKFLEYKIQGGDICSPYLSTENRGNCPNAPTFSQCFSWFREKYSLIGNPNHYGGLKHPNMPCNYKISGNTSTGQPIIGQVYDNYEEAELECLVELIDIVKKQNLKG